MALHSPMAAGHVTATPGGTAVPNLADKPAALRATQQLLGLPLPEEPVYAVTDRLYDHGRPVLALIHDQHVAFLLDSKEEGVGKILSRPGDGEGLLSVGSRGYPPVLPCGTLTPGGAAHAFGHRRKAVGCH